MSQLKSLLAETIDFTELPTLPPYAKIAIKSGLDSETSVEELSRIIRESPSLTFRVLKVANSAFYKRSGKVSTIKDAVILLGYNTIKGLILGITLSEIFNRDRINGLDYRGFWVHSIATAIAAESIGKSINLKDERLYIAGLLHDIGKVVLASLIPDKYRQVIENVEKGAGNFYQVEEKTLGFTHVEVGEFVLENWQFPNTLISLITAHHKATNTLEDQSKLVIRLSNEITHLADYRIIKSEPPVELENEIIERIGLLKEEIDTAIQQINTNISPILEILKTEYRPRCYFDLLSSANNRLSDLFLSLSQKNAEIQEKNRISKALNNIIIHIISQKDIKKAITQTLSELIAAFNMEFGGIELYLTENKSLLVYGINPAKETGEETQIHPAINVVIGPIKSGFKTNKARLELPVKNDEGKIIGNIYLPQEAIQNTEILTAINLISTGINLFRSRIDERIKAEKLVYLNRKLGDKIEENTFLLNLYSMILNNTPFGIACVDENMKVISHNRAMSDILKTEVLINMKLDEIEIVKKTELLNTMRDLYLSGGEKIVHIDIDEYPKILKISFHPISETNKKLVIIDDVTGEYEREKKLIQQEKLITLGQLAAGISHNLKSPLAVIKGIPELILTELEEGNIRIIRKTDGEEIDDRETKERLNLIIESIKKTLSIIDSILNYAKKEEVQFEKLDLTEIIEQTKELLDHLIKEKGVTITTDLRTRTLYGNRDMILQIFLNLLQNSIEAMDYGGNISITSKKADKGTIIQFDDNGPGVKNEDLERIFEPFYTTSKEAEGRGLGLSITRKLVSLHGGIIKAMNLSPHGLRIEIKFPDFEASADV